MIGLLRFTRSVRNTRGIHKHYRNAPTTVWENTEKMSETLARISQWSPRAGPALYPSVPSTPQRPGDWSDRSRRLAVEPALNKIRSRSLHCQFQSPSLPIFFGSTSVENFQRGLNPNRLTDFEHRVHHSLISLNSSGLPITKRGPMFSRRFCEKRSRVQCKEIWRSFPLS
jgi:hypothetical protein